LGRVILQANQLFHHIFVANRGFNKLDTAFCKVVIERAIGHVGRNDRVRRKETLSLQVICQDGKHMISIHQVAIFVDEDDPVCITIKGDAKISVVLANQGGNVGRV